MVIGHSLGAGVAALLAMHLRMRYPNMHCWAFAPPGGLLSPAAARASRDWCTSIIIAKDMIPRLSLGCAAVGTAAASHPMAFKITHCSGVGSACCSLQPVPALFLT